MFFVFFLHVELTRFLNEVCIFSTNSQNQKKAQYTQNHFRSREQISTEFTLINPLSVPLFKFLKTHCFHDPPSGPGGPLLPWSPGGPWLPLGPWEPGGPSSPVRPGGPCGPLFPGVPGTPGIPGAQLLPQPLLLPPHCDDELCEFTKQKLF